MAGSTPIYGFPYPQSTDLVADYPALGQELATDVETVISGLGSGLNIVTPTSIANSGGSASLSGAKVTFTGVTSVSLNGVFTSTYANYLLILNANGSADSATNMRLRVAGTDATSNYNYQQLTAENTTISGTRTLGASTLEWNYVVRNNANASIYRSLVGNPAVATNTAFESGGADIATGNTGVGFRAFAGSHATATAYDGFTFYPTSGNVTGTIRVYGLKN